jgi:hypothetical protein
VSLVCFVVSSALLFAVALLDGCSSGPDWKRRTYSFSRPVDPAATNAPGAIVALKRVAISPLFQSRSFTYRTAENTYEQDPYAGFLIPPERALAESIRAYLRTGGIFGRVAEPGSSLVPNVVVEVFVNELYADFRNPSQPVGRLEIHFLCYEVKDGIQGRILLDQAYARQTPLKTKTPEALMAAWDADLHEIMQQIHTEYAKANTATGRFQ